MAQSALHRKTVKRFNEPFGIHALTFSCYKRQAFLSKDRTRQYFCDAVIRARQTHGYHVWGYVVMPEHVHIVFWFPHETYSISKVLQSIKQSTARRAVRYLRLHNPSGLRLLATGQSTKPYCFWLDGGGYDHNVRTNRNLQTYLDYIHANPVVRELVPHENEWYWSSAADWRGVREGPIPLDKDSFPMV